MAKKFEYKEDTVYYTSTFYMNDMGKDRWELVSVYIDKDYPDKRTYFWKRELTQSKV